MEDGQLTIRLKFLMKKSNRTVIVFGVSGSIGKKIFIHLEKSGYNVIGVSRGGSEFNNTLKCDLTIEEDVKNLFLKISKITNKFDSLILAHGVQLRKKFHSISSQEWDYVINGNLRSNFLILKYFCPHLIDHDFGRIIGISSLTSSIVIKNLSAYSSSKGGFEQLIKSVAIEYSNYNITANTINPGRIDTTMTADLINNKNSNNSIISRIPKNRFGKPEDLLSAVDFLISEHSSYITGQSITIDGGWLASGGNPSN
jgi:NAD(P)-dependent dehydrogenase (short-subunit alcohol dehydrogenase family)